MATLSPQAAEILERAMELSDKERGQLIDRLAASLDEGPPDEGVEGAWASEIKRRIDEIDSGKARMIPLSEFRRRIAARMRNLDRPTEVTIVAVAHHKRRPGYWKNRI